MKLCPKCGITKKKSEFHKNNSKKDGCASYCKECRIYYSKWHYNKDKKKYLERNKKNSWEWGKKNREYLQNLKSSQPCTDCGKYYHYCQMDYDHIKGKKTKSVSELVSRTRSSIKSIDREIKKCELVCANCHRLRTWKRLTKKSNAGDSAGEQKQPS